MKKRVGKTCLALMLAMSLFAVPTQAVFTASMEPNSVVELGPEEYGILVEIEDPLVPVTDQFTQIHRQMTDMVVPVLTGVLTWGLVNGCP